VPQLDGLLAGSCAAFQPLWDVDLSGFKTAAFVPVLTDTGRAWAHSVNPLLHSSAFRMLWLLCAL